MSRHGSAPTPAPRRRPDRLRSAALIVATVLGALLVLHLVALDVLAIYVFVQASTGPAPFPLPY